MGGIGLVIEVVAGDIHLGGVDAQHVEIGIDPVQRVMGVEIDLRDQRIGGHDGFHDRVQPDRAPDLVLFGRADGHHAGVENRRSAAVAGGVEGPVFGIGIGRFLIRRHIRGGRGQGAPGFIGIDAGQGGDGFQPPGDHRAFACRRIAQGLGRDAAHGFGAAVIDHLAGAPVEADKGQFNQEKRHQRRADIGSPEPCLQRQRA